MGTEPRIVQLIVKHLQNELSSREREELEEWMRESAGNRQFVTAFMTPEKIRDRLERQKPINADSIYRKFKSKIKDQPQSVKERGRRRRIASLPMKYWWGAVVVISVTIMVVSLKGPARKHGFAASLTLANGKIINLDTVAIGKYIKSDGWLVVKEGEHQIAYYPCNGMDVLDRPFVSHHMLSVPYGQTWGISLPDGSKVRLSTGSRMSYSVVPTGDIRTKRTAFLQGEALFDVASSNNFPFTVGTGKGEVTVLCSRFNIRDYKTEDLFRATSLTGLISVTNGNKKMTLWPGAEVRTCMNGNSYIVTAHADTAKALSWCCPWFTLDDMTTLQVMQQVVPWYGMSGIIYRGMVDTVTPGLLGGGHVDKSIPLPELLDNLQRDGIEFSIEGKRIVITQHVPLKAIHDQHCIEQ